MVNKLRLTVCLAAVLCSRYLHAQSMQLGIDASNAKLAAELDWVNARVNVVYHYYRMKYITHTL